MRPSPTFVPGFQTGSAYPHSIEEMTTVTRKLRRVARFDWQLAEAATVLNRPSTIAVNGLDYLAFGDKCVQSYSQLSARSREFVGELEYRLGVPVAFCGTSPS